MSPTLFLDRDGVLNVDRSYAFRVEDLELMPGVAASLGKAVEVIPDLLLVVVTNQGGIGLQYYSEDEMRGFNSALASRLEEEGGAKITRFYHCPHHPRAISPDLKIDCDCRKPGTGMVDAACKDFSIDKSRSWLIGDKAADINCARRAGLAGAVQILGDYPAHETPDASFENAGEAVQFIVEKLRGQKASPE